IVVAAKSGGVERTLQAKFMPGMAENPYRRLIASGVGVTYNTANSTNPAAMRMEGMVWHPVRSAADSAWTGYVNWVADRPLEGDMPPIPQADAFVDDHWATAADVPEIGGGAPPSGPARSEPAHNRPPPATPPDSAPPPRAPPPGFP